MPPVSGDDETEKTSPVSLIPMAFVAAGVLVLALIVSGKTQPGRIVVQRITLGSTTSRRGKSFRQRTVSLTAITEVSAGGHEQRSFTSNSITNPGFQQASAGTTLQLYDPRDNTVYVTTERDELRAAMAPFETHPLKGTTSRGGVGKLQSISASSVGYLPGTSSPYDQWLRESDYRVAGHTTIDGLAAIRLVQPLPAAVGSGDFQSRVTVYLAAGSHDPIETVDRVKLPGMHVASVERWQTYRVLRATAANQRLLSLTARHPQARVVASATAYLRASQSEIRTTTVRTG